jgi:uncharacterized repeat protein (TIGR01451 family)
MSDRCLSRARWGALLLSALVWGSATADQSGQRLAGSPGTRESISAIQDRQSTSTRTTHVERRLAYPDKSAAAQNPNAPAVAQFPGDAPRSGPSTNIHTTAAAFDGATLADVGTFPPDSMGAIGPAQFVTFVNGRIRSFTKTGVADGVLNVDPDVFFASVMTPVGGSVLSNFTNHPQVRYDRFSARWFLTITDVPCTDATCTTAAANRVLIAVSDAASNGTLSGSTVWTFFQFQADPGTNSCDNASLGVDVNALYIGCNMLGNAGSLSGTNGYVVRKTSILGAGPATVTMFANLVAGGTGAGPFSPRGVDNYDQAATEGYFVGVDNATFSTVVFRRVSNPGSATPTISANISVTVPTTTFPNPVTHAGNTGGNNGRLESLDDRLYAAMIRNGRLWSAHNFRVSAAGVANTAAAARNAVRWYEFQNLTTTPTLVQSGTVFDNAATLAAARQYWMPSVIVTGQGHSVMGMTMAGTPVGATPVYVGRLAGDTLGTMAGPPTVAAVAFGTSTANYNPPADPGGAAGRRWGGYSFTSLDPLDDMTVWTIQEYNEALNSFAVRVGRLAAPPPATPTCSGSPVTFAGPTGNVVINATSGAGSGFYDPGANLPAPALPFTHLSATVTNATVNSVTYNSPTQVTLNITALATGLQNVTVTNPDGQAVTANGCIDAQNALAADLAITKTDGVATAVPGGSVTYTITASNPSAVAATSAAVADTFPASLTCTWTCVGAGGGTCTASGSGNIADTVNLPAGASTTYTASCAISAAATGTLSNTATVTIAGDPNAANNSATDTDTLTPQANLGITKTDGVTTATAGGSVTYTITASNAGPSNAPGSTVADTFPASLTCTWTCVGAGGGTCTASGSGNIADTVNLPAGGSTTHTASCTISASASGTLSNTATVAAPAGVTDPTPGNNSATDSDTLTAQADLSITKTDGVTSATPGGSVTYTITASNAGPSNATGATVADTFPASLTCTWTCVGAGGGTCTASGSGNIADTVNLPAGGSTTHTASCTVSASASGTLSNTATVAAPGGVTDPTPGNNSATDTDTLTALADLTITKTHAGNFTQGQTGATYALTASNVGGSPTSGVVTVTDTLPTGLSAVAIGGAGWSCTLGTLTCTRSDALAAGSSYPTITLTVNVAGNAPASLTNTATVSGGGQTNTANDSASDPTTITQLSDLTIAKTHVGNFTQGQTGAVYTLTASNAGAGPTSGTVTVTDTLPAGLTATAIGGTGWSCTLATLTCTRSDALAAGSSYPAISLTVSVANTAPASLTNTATVSGGGQTNTGNDSASDPTTIATATYTIGGNVSGATSPAALTLSDSTNGTSQSTSSNGAFTFTTPLPIGASWSVAVTTPPSGQSCVVANGAGTNLSANVTNVQVTCASVLVTITPATLTAGTYSLPYSQQLSAGSSDSLDHTPYTFTLASGSLPTSLTLGTDGLLSGTPTAAGSFTFTVQAAGSGGVSGTQAYTLVVNRATTTVTVTATPNPTTQGVPVNLVATVASGTPTGTVSFSADGTTLPCSPVTVVVGTTSSTAACTTTFTTAGAHPITASYSGDANFEPSTSPVIAVVVDMPAVPVPALDRWAMLLLCALLAMAMLVRLRRT